MSREYSLEVSKPEVDNSGYDIIAEANGILRHVQLKATYVGASTPSQKIHIDLQKKPSGCVVWIYFDQENLDLGPFLFFGGAPGEALPDISAFKVAKHTKGNSKGEKTERPNIRVINKGVFVKYETIQELYNALFANKHAAT